MRDDRSLTSECHHSRVFGSTDTQSADLSPAYAGHIHPPKHETFDLVARTNTDPKGIVRDVDTYTVHPWGLYMARPTPGRAQFHYLESWLLPSLGLRVNVFHFNPGHERQQDYYLDFGELDVGDEKWEWRDLYVDLVLRVGDHTELLDVDELLDAHRHGLVTDQAAESVIRRAVTTVEGLAKYDNDLSAWLASSGMDLSWR